MCGITGVIDLSGRAIDPTILKSMNDAIRHRGPDDEGYVLLHRTSGRSQSYAGPDSPEAVQASRPMLYPETSVAGADVGLTHRRFSIVDLSSAGHQPFFSQDGKCCVTFNGEIYNYIELRAELEALGVVFRTRSDTEVLVEAYRVWGTGCFRRFNGFWAIALYDFERRLLILSRDRLGKRPLYYAREGDRVWFASEIKALLRVPAIAARRKVRPEAVWYWCVDGMRDLDDTTMFDGINNLPAASYAVVDAGFPNQIVKYWNVPHERMTENDVSVPEAAASIRDLLTDAVRIRLRADVPIAFELSGGLDSSTVLALASGCGRGKLRTYTVRFAEPYNEEPFARSVASRYDVDYRIIDPELDRFWQGVGAFTHLQEEPYHSPNLQSSQAIWSAMRDEGTKVVLTGSAGDEMFAGYAKYYWRAQIENLRAGRWSLLIDNARNWTERKHSVHTIVREAVMAAGLRGAALAVKRALVTRDYLVGVGTPQKLPYAKSLTEWLYTDITNTLIPYWLMSGDKTLMGVPFEGRCPFLDYRMVELATTLPVTYLIRHGWHKWILRKAMEDLLPAEVVWRRTKMGFPFPYETFYEKYRDVIDLTLNTARNPFIDFSQKATLRTNWRALSFILWYEMFINENYALFKKIEDMVRRPPSATAPSFVPAFLQAAPG
jgi:asparagine synthase (glutamine-hydrolysing)